jgi:pyruvate-formate lyase-activating enzyme
MVPTVLDNKGTRILAKSLFKELRTNGYSTNQILSLSTELIDLVTQDLKGAVKPEVAAPAPMRNDSQEGWRAAL